MRPITLVWGETCLISPAKLGSNSKVLTTATPPARNRRKSSGSLRPMKMPNLLGGPGGKGVETGVEVAWGTGTLVALGGVGVRVGSGVGADWLLTTGRY